MDWFCQCHEIKNLHATVSGKEILKGINLTVNAGEVHAIMGPNGSGKSTLSYVISGKDGYEVTEGQILYNGIDLTEMEPEIRAAEGVFLAFQYPVEIPGVPNVTFLKEAVNAVRRAVNAGFSGGEKKRNEILQMAVLNPKLAVLDETDSGLDIDALKIVSDGVNQLRSDERAILVITHYQRLLDHIVPDFVHVLAHGRIQRSGGKELAFELEEKGYAEYGVAAE